jgi:hypothetical protein
MITRELTIHPENGPETSITVDADGDLLLKQNGDTVLITKAMLDEFDEAMREVRS